MREANMLKDSVASRIRVCQVESCGRKHYGHGYCEKHLRRSRKNGETVSKNIYNVGEKFYRVEIFDRNFIKVGEALVDSEDIIKIKGFKWHVHPNGYVHNNKGTPMHHIILDFIFDGYSTVVDHINGNRKDNRKSNLRLVSNGENCLNRHSLNSNNSSGYYGVCWKKESKKWCARITRDGKRVHLGYFVNKDDAAMAYDKAVANCTDNKYRPSNNISQRLVG